MKSTSAKSTINAPQPDASSLAWRLNSLAFEASISPLIDITVSSVSAFALRQAPQQSKNAVPLRCEAWSMSMGIALMYQPRRFVPDVAENAGRKKGP
jgi:hypothetical protein